MVPGQLSPLCRRRSWPHFLGKYCGGWPGNTVPLSHTQFAAQNHHRSADDTALHNRLTESREEALGVDRRLLERFEKQLLLKEGTIHVYRCFPIFIEDVFLTQGID